MNKVYLFVLLLLLFGSNRVMAQTQKDSDSSEVFTFVEQMPEFPGGYKEMQKFIKANLIFPNEAREAKVQGIVVMQFIVEKDGNITQINQINKVLGYGCDEEAKRLISIMPKWIAGHQNGNPVRCKYTLPIKFN